MYGMAHETNRDKDDSLLQLALSLAQDDDDQQDTNMRNGVTGVDESDNKVADLFSQQVPPNASDLANADSVIASQMAKLSVTDREQVYMDVHGISDYGINETPELIAQSLSDLQEEIERLPDKRAYTIAERLDPQYVRNPEFLLAFLRCERFDCPKTALRIIRHFHMKLDLFGMDKLVLDITQDDLDVDDMEVLYSCTGRFLRTRDRGGRIINLIVTVPRSRVFKTDAVLRKSFYNCTVGFRDDEEVQRRGAVTVLFQSDVAFSEINTDLVWKMSKLNEGSPMRVTAVHFCWSHEALREPQALMKNAFSKPLKVRTRVHHGTVQECLNELRGHGIDPNCIPLNDKAEITDLLEERQWQEAQRRHERLNFPLRSTIHVFCSQDVLLGKGTPFQTHPGNMRLRQLVSDQIKQYDKAPKGEKKEFVEGIMDTIRQSGGLFLKQDGAKWSRVNDDVARSKVAAAFRTLRWVQKKSGT